MNTTVVITGGGGVLCSAFAKEMARTGAPVALLDRNLQAAEHTAEEIAQEGGTARAYAADVLDQGKPGGGPTPRCSAIWGNAGCSSTARAATHRRPLRRQETFPGRDGAAAEFPSFFDLQPEGFDFVFRLNLMGTLLPSQVFARDMLGEGGCCILNVSSMNAYRPLTKIPAYSAAKAAVSNFTQWLAVHFAEQGIRVNAIAPGFFVTGQNRSLLFDEEGNPTERTAKILRATPMKRFGEPEELLGALRWLTDEKASGFVTGVVVPVDGGFSAYSGV